MSSEKIDFYSEGVIRPVNLNSIAESSLIPRESVRRIVNSLISKNILRKDKNKIYVTEFVTNPKFLATSNDDVLRTILHDTLIIIVNMFNPN
jgi:DNA-binding IclR family transcriptional regulator